MTAFETQSSENRFEIRAPKHGMVRLELPCQWERIYKCQWITCMPNRVRTLYYRYGAYRFSFVYLITIVE